MLEQGLDLASERVGFSCGLGADPEAALRSGLRVYDYWNWSWLLDSTRPEVILKVPRLLAPTRDETTAVPLAEEEVESPVRSGVSCL